MTKHPIRALPLFILSLAILICANRLYAQSGDQHFERVDCPPEISNFRDLECGLLTVPEDYDDPAAGSIELPVTILHSREADPEPDPLIFMSGLPGANLYPHLGDLVGSALRDRRDLILLEYRGVGASHPRLSCEIELLAGDALPCLQDLLEQDIELAQYTTNEIVADLNALRQVMGYSEWNLYGNTFSSLVMIQAMQNQPEGIRSLILDSVIPPATPLHDSLSLNYARALDSFFDECASDVDCAAAYPNLKDRFYALVDRLNEEPLSLETTGQTRIEIDGDWLLAQTFDALYGHVNASHAIDYWPLLIVNLEQGRHELLQPWLDQPVIDWEENLTFGAYFSLICQDFFGLSDSGSLLTQHQDFPELDGWAQSAFARKICEAWQLPAATGQTDLLPATSIPLLVLAGQHDPVTNPAWGKQMADALDSGYFFEFPAMGNWVSAADPCVQQIANDFLNNPGVKPDIACFPLADSSGFILPADLRLEPGVYHFISDIRSGDRDILLTALLGFSLLIFLAEIIYVAGFAVPQLAESYRKDMTGRTMAFAAHGLALTIVLLNLLFVVVFNIRLTQLMAVTPLLLRFGLPAADSPLFLMPFLAEILSAALLFISFFVWIIGYWSLRQRIFLSVVTLAAVLFTSLMAYWGFLPLS